MSKKNKTALTTAEERRRLILSIEALDRKIVENALDTRRLCVKRAECWGLLSELTQKEKEVKE